MTVQLPQPDQYSDWRDWARAALAQLTIALENPEVVVAPSVPTDPPTEFDNITIKDNLDRIILNPDGLWIWDPFGQLPIAPGIFEINTQHLVDAAITTAKLQDLAVDTAKLAALSVDASKLIDGSVTTTKIANLAVGTAAIAIGAVGSAQIADAAILTALIGDLQVTTGKIDDLAVNEAKIANAAISSAKIQDLQVTTAKIANGAIDALKIGAAVINRTHIQDGEIVNAKIAEVIQSSGWSDATKQGWRINKAGQIEGSSIAIYDQYGYLVFGANVPSYSNANLVRNGNFNQGFADWILYDGDGFASLSLVPSSLGGDCIRVTWATPATFWPKGIAQPRASALFAPNETYVLSFYARGVVSLPGTISAAWNVPPAETIAISQPELSSSWQRYVFRFKLGATVEPAALYLGFQGAGATGYVEFDNIQWERGLWPSEWKENLTEASELAVWSSITGAGKPADNADVTAFNIAAGIAGQGALATQSAVSLETQVLGLLANSRVSGLGAMALIGDGAIISAKIGDGEISSAKIQDAAITDAKIADAAISSAKIADASITNAKIANLDAGKITTGELAADRIKLDGVTITGDGNGNLIIGTGGVNTAQLAAGSVVRSNFATRLAAWLPTADTWAEAFTVSLDVSAGTFVRLDFSGFATIQRFSTGDSESLLWRVVRDSTVVAEGILVAALPAVSFNVDINGNLSTITVPQQQAANSSVVAYDSGYSSGTVTWSFQIFRPADAVPSNLIGSVTEFRR